MLRFALFDSSIPEQQRATYRSAAATRSCIGQPGQKEIHKTRSRTVVVREPLSGLSSRIEQVVKDFGKYAERQSA
jgi:hypothetical protein